MDSSSAASRLRFRWGRKRTQTRQQRSIPLLFLFVSISLLFLFFYFRSLLPFAPPKAIVAATSSPLRIPQCGPLTREGSASLAGERFLWYAPHSGFSNQVSELKNALLLAAILNRTLIVPPVLDHHAVALGSCPKFRVSTPSELRERVWDHIMELARDRRYVSMADIVDLSSVTPSMVKTIDFRVFASTWCGLNMDSTCFGNMCCAMSSIGSLSSNSNQCRSLVSGLHGNIGQCVYAVEEDCRTTVWTYQQGNDGDLDSFQPDDQLRKRKKIFYIRKCRDIYKALGPRSKAESATILAFGSLFSSPYKSSESHIDIHEAPRDSRIQLLLTKIEFLPFSPEIISAGKKFAADKIKEPFLCAQLRLLDGQFKNHWKATFSAIEQKLQSLQSEHKQTDARDPTHIFIMTDLPAVNWSGTYLDDIVKDTSSYKLYTLQEGDELVVQAAKRLMAAEHGLRSGLLPGNVDGLLPGNVDATHRKKVCYPVLLPDILLYIEEVVCSCGSLGFVGTAGSTIAESIGILRKNNICKL